MDKNDLLRCIAETAYNVGYSAKLHFSTHDMVDKVPGFIGFMSMVVGIFGLYINEFSTKPLSATFIVLGIIGLYISFYSANKQDYAEAGEKLTKQFNDLKKLYFSVKSVQEDELAEYIEKLSKIENEFCETCISKHLILSGWYAHYKFFWQQQIEWVDEQKHFNFLRDKVPLSLSVTLVFFVILLIMLWSSLFEKVCGYFVS